MNECLACKGDIQPEEIPLLCTVCKYAYHVGKCSGITVATFRSKGESLKGTWKCGTCQTSEKKGGASSNLSDSQRLECKLNQLNGNILALLPLVPKVDALSEAVKAISGIEASMQLLSDKYDTILAKIDSQGTEVTALRKRVEQLESKTAETAPSSQEVKDQLNELEQYSRRLNIEVHGMEKQANENLLSKMNCLARTLELPELSDSDLVSLHRLQPRAGNKPVIIARFRSVMLNERWMQIRSRLREKESSLRIFDNLTPTNKRLLWLAQTKGKEMRYNYVWQRNGHVFVRKADGDRAIRIHRESDLELMV